MIPGKLGTIIDLACARALCKSVMLPRAMFPTEIGVTAVATTATATNKGILNRQSFGKPAKHLEICYGRHLQFIFCALYQEINERVGDKLNNTILHSM